MSTHHHRQTANTPAEPITLAAFGRELAAGRDVEAGRLTACLSADIVKDAEADGAEAGAPRSYTFTISSGIVDRDRDIIHVDGWQTDAFMAAGGPVLYGHGFDANGTLPIGKATKVWAAGGALKASMVFLPGDPFAERVQRAVDFGALRATSVGFRPLPGRAAWNDERQGVDFLEQELLEFSIVPVPANPAALREKGFLDFGAGVLAKLHGLEAVMTCDPRVYLLNTEALNAALDLATVLGKRGRVLSAANEQRIRTAHGHGQDLVTTLADVIAQVSAEDPDASDESASALAEVVADPVFLRIVPNVAPRLTRADVREVCITALKELVAARVRYFAGRID